MLDLRRTCHGTRCVSAHRFAEHLPLTPIFMYRVRIARAAVHQCQGRYVLHQDMHFTAAIVDEGVVVMDRDKTTYFSSVSSMADA